MCLDLKVKARKLCERHYAQLRRLGAFERQRAATDLEAIANISSDRLAKARDILERAAPMAARDLKLASKVAASKGDGKAALALLLHSRAVEPITQNRPDMQPSLQPVINIGFAVAGVTATKTITLPETGQT